MQLVSVGCRAASAYINEAMVAYRSLAMLAWRRKDFISGEAQLAIGIRGRESNKISGQTNDF